MKSPLSKFDLIKKIIRVNHAGEYAAVRIYKSQARVFKEKEFKKMLEHMKEQESHHLEYFAEALKQNEIRPTKLLPLWKILSHILGYGTALLGKKAAMVCTVAVEEIISDHYQEQISQLDDGELKDKIRQFRQEEIEHHDIGIENKAEEAFGYNVLSKVIKCGCRIAIALSKKV